MTTLGEKVTIGQTKVYMRLEKTQRQWQLRRKKNNYWLDWDPCTKCDSLLALIDENLPLLSLGLPDGNGLGEGVSLPPSTAFDKLGDRLDFRPVGQLEKSKKSKRSVH